MEKYKTGTGQNLTVHDEAVCSVTRGLATWCVIHKRMPGHMQAWPTHWRSDWGGFMEVICPHGIGHPAPESKTTAGFGHGCDGCCRDSEPVHSQGYRYRSGGLMRCCLQTLVMTYADNTAEYQAGEGDKLPCRFCSSSMVFKDGAWEWDKSRAAQPPVPIEAELA